MTAQALHSPPNQDAYPAGYRSLEVGRIEAAVRAGECVGVVGLSGAGKSNLLQFLAQRARSASDPVYVLVDGNRLSDATPAGLLGLMRRALVRAWPHDREAAPSDDPLEALDEAVTGRLSAAGSANLCFLLDLSQLVDRGGGLLGAAGAGFLNNLRALRDGHKFRLSYVAATRRPLPAQSELAELFSGNTVWLGPLSAADAAWTVERYAARRGLAWNAATVAALSGRSGRYPSLLRAMCEAHAAGTALETEALGEHAAVQARLREFWADAPTEAELRAAGLDRIAALMAGRAPAFDTSRLTAKEHRLLACLQARAGEVCTKDELIRAVWPEDRVQTDGVRDDSLAQLVRRLREKIEPDPSRPRYVLTVPGRGYRYAAGHDTGSSA